MRQLYAIREDFFRILNPHPADEESDSPVPSEAELRTELAALEIEFDDKIENCIAYLKNIRAEEEALSAEIKRLTARKKAAQNRADSLKRYTLTEMELAGKVGVQVGVHKARLAKSQDAVIVLDETLVPDFYVKIERKVQKREILCWYKETGEILDGIEIETDRNHLRIS